MKKYQFGLLALTTILLACNPDDRPGAVETNAIVGKWKLTTLGGQEVLTDNRTIYTFDAGGRGTQTLSKDIKQMGEKSWYMQQKMKYTLSGNALHTQWTGSSVVLEWLASIQSINSNEFTVDQSRVLLQTQPVEDMAPSVWKRCPQKYDEDVVGLWEGTSFSGYTYGDHNHRWLFVPSGEYYYYNMDSAKWEWYISENEMNNYDVDGDYLAFKWIQHPGQPENREFWDIQINDHDMSWSALREDANTHQRFNATFTMRRVSPTQTEAEKYLKGKWIACQIDGKDIKTNEKSVHTFNGKDTVYYTVPDTTKDIDQWHNRLALNYSLMGSYLVEKGKDNNGKLVEWSSNLTEIDDDSLLVYAFTSTRDVKDFDLPYHIIRLAKVREDFQEMITCKDSMIWKGVSGGGDYGSADHLWEYLEPDKTGVRHYVYYSKNTNNEWYSSNDVPGKYMVDGNWLATSWVLDNKINYEWWDISIKNDTMTWTGLREGKTTGFTLVRVHKSKVGPFAK